MRRWLREISGRGGGFGGVECAGRRVYCCVAGEEDGVEIVRSWDGIGGVGLEL